MRRDVRVAPPEEFDGFFGLILIGILGVGCVVLGICAGIQLGVQLISEKSLLVDKSRGEVMLEASSVMFVCGVLLRLVGWVIHSIWTEKSDFEKAMDNLSYEDRLGVLHHHPMYLKSLPHHTEEMAMVAIRSNSAVLRFTPHRHSHAFLQQMVKLRPNLILQLFPHPPVKENDHNRCKLWQIAIQQEPTLIRHAPRQFEYYEFEIYRLAATANPSVTHRIPTMELQSQIRAAIGFEFTA